jgi:predicted transcriptional regulator
VKSQPLSIRLEHDLNDQVSAIATALDRSKSWVIEQALKDYVALQKWQLTAIDEGIQAADSRALVSHDAVKDWMQSWGQADVLPPPKCG